MMSIYNKIVSKVKLPPDNFVGGFTLILHDGRGVFLEGHKGVYNFSNTFIEVKIKKGLITISGENLKIETIGINELYISGSIGGISKIEN
ncbi:MAG: YabP/YqfC family sporulation protein [Christensenellaceae bacterium]|jgi:sporulation protein YqfC|nr:YabP/YqfC family sporulation protein [Christensenellaceae bacterium]